MNNDSEKEQGIIGEGVIEVSLRWSSADHLPTLYANHLVISHSGPEFYLIFGELAPPLLKERKVIGTDEMPEHVEIKPVVKLAITPESMLKMADAINTNIDKFMSAIQPEEGE